MRWLALWMAVSGSMVAMAAAQEAPSDEAEPLESYVVELIEIRLPAGNGPRLTAGELVAQFDRLEREGKLEVVEVLRMSTLAGHQSMAQFGKTVYVPTGLSLDPRRGQIKQFQRQNVGTIARVTAGPRAGKIVLELNYEASRLAPSKPAAEADEIGSTEILTVQFDTALALELGERKLVGGTTADATSFLLVSISK